MFFFSFARLEKTRANAKKSVWAKITLLHQKILDMRCYEADIYMFRKLVMDRYVTNQNVLV